MLLLFVITPVACPVGVHNLTDAVFKQEDFNHSGLFLRTNALDTLCLRYLKGWMKIWQLLHCILEGQNVLEVRCSRSFLGKEIGCKRADVPDF